MYRSERSDMRAVRQVSEAARGRGWAAALVVALVGCGGASSGDDAGSDPGTDAARNGSVSLSVVSARYETEIMRVRPAVGNRFLVLNLSLQNVSAPSPIAGDPLRYSVMLSTRLVVSASATSAALPMACRADVSAATGGVLMCAVSFEVGVSDMPQSVTYSDQQGHVATAAVPTPEAPPASPLVGRWSGMAQSGLPLVAVWTLNADGTAVLTESAGSPCTGMISFNGGTWSTTETQITFGGNPTCAGMLMCGSSPITCSALAGQDVRGTCSFALSNNNATLTLSNCTPSSANGTYTRM
jgi:hypothetical protein